MTNEVRAGAVNGGVDAMSTGGPVQASTVNGSVPHDGQLDGDQGPQLLHRERQRGGRIRRRQRLPTSISLMNGRFQTDWP